MDQQPLVPLRLRQLFDAVCDEVATNEQIEELQGILRADEQARQYYMEYCQLIVDLFFEACERQMMADAVIALVETKAPVGPATTAETNAPPAPKTPSANPAAVPVAGRPAKSPVLGFLGGVMDYVNHSRMLMFWLMALGVSGWFMFQLGALKLGHSRPAGAQVADHPAAAKSPDAPHLPGVPLATAASAGQGDPVASVMAMTDCQWTDPVLQLGTGVGLAAGRTLDLASGTIALTFSCGAVVTIRGPAVVSLDSGKSLFLSVGRVTTRAGVASAKGFQVRTRTAHVVDLGTEFSTQVSPEGRSEIYVSEGSVDVQVAAGDGGPGVVRAGDSVLIEPGTQGVLARVEAGDGTPAFRFRTIEPPSNAAYSDASHGHASIRVVEGQLNHDSGAASVLLRGHGQSTGDSPPESVFFKNNLPGGRILMDLGKSVRVRQINTYSWHDFAPVPEDYHVRAVQRYTLYGASGDTPPATSGNDLVSSGWTLIGRVNTDEFFTVPPIRSRPAQQAVAISAANGSLGRYRYLLWDVRPTTHEAWSKRPEIGEDHTFFGKFDVYAEEDSADGGPRSLPAPDSVRVDSGVPSVLVRAERGDGTPAFRFNTIGPPSTAAWSDASRDHASIRAVGRLAPDSGPVSVLLGGHGQSTGNSPAESFFFHDNELGGRLVMDLGQPVRVRQINTYSWYDPGAAAQDYHVRAAQQYTLYGALGDTPPKVLGGFVKQGWTLIVRVKTDELFGVPPAQNRPAQQAVAISASKGSLGPYRYLLWDTLPTFADAWSDHPQTTDKFTFFGKFDVYSDEDSAEPGQSPNILKSSVGGR